MGGGNIRASTEVCGDHTGPLSLGLRVEEF